MAGVHSAAVAAYLAAPPYGGRSNIRDKDALKGPVGARWNADRKQWTAPDLATLRRMIDTNKWTPEAHAPTAAVLAALDAKGMTAEAAAAAAPAHRPKTESWQGSLPTGPGRWQQAEPSQPAPTPLTAQDLAHMERSRRMPPIPAYHAECTRCGMTIFEQFLDCACTSRIGISWARCPVPPCTRFRPTLRGVMQACACGDAARMPKSSPSTTAAS